MQKQPARLVKLDRFDKMIPHMLRYSVLLSTQATVTLINLLPAASTVLQSEECRDFLIGCGKRGDAQILAALKSKGVSADQLHPRRLEARIAAEKGKAFQAAMRYMAAEADSPGSHQATKAKSSQTVLLLPQLDLVLKKMNKRSQEEEGISGDLFDLCKESTAVPAIRIRSFCSERFGFSPHIVSITFRVHDFDSLRYFFVASKISQGRDQFHQAATNQITPFNECPGKELYEEHCLEKWHYSESDQWRSVHFSKLVSLIMFERISPKSKIRFRAEEFTLAKLLCDQSFLLAMNYCRKLPELVVCPDIDARDEVLCQKALKTSWTVRYAPQESRVLTFKELIKQYLEGYIDAGVDMAPVGIRDDEERKKLHLFAKRVLAASFGCYTPYRHVRELNGVALDNIVVKPFVHGMYRIYDMDKNFLKCACERLDESSQFNAILFSELQLYDLHSLNLAVRAKTSCENEGFMPILFETPVTKAAVSFHELLRLYFETKLQDASCVTYVMNSKKFSAKLADLADLLRAIQKTQYELILFDGDFVLAETNGVHCGLFTGVNKIGHYIPIRSCLLNEALPALSAELKDQLKHSEERDKRLLDWLKSANATIYRFMKPQDKSKIMEEVLGFATQPHYSLSYYHNRLYDPKARIGKIRQTFSKQLAECNTADKRAFWNRVQGALQKGGWFRPYQVRLGEVEGLMPKPDITSSSALAKKYREKIAAQLFPRATMYQIAAFQERLTRRVAHVHATREPSYTTITHALYPLLTPAWEALLLLYPHHSPDWKIGEYTYPMEQLVTEMKEKVATARQFSPLTLQQENHLSSLQQQLVVFTEALDRQIKQSTIKDKNGCPVLEPAF